MSKHEAEVWVAAYRDLGINAQAQPILRLDGTPAAAYGVGVLVDGRTTWLYTTERCLATLCKYAPKDAD